MIKEVIDVGYTPVLLKGSKLDGFYETPEIKAIICSNLQTSLDEVVSRMIPIEKEYIWYTRIAYAAASMMMTTGFFIF